MKKIEAIIRPEKLGDVRQALEAAGYPGIQIMEVEGHGKQKGVTQQWRGEEYRMDYLPKLRLEIVAPTADVDRIVQAIIKNAKTGAVGDGKIFISEIKDAIRIRTGEHGEDAI